MGIDHNFARLAHVDRNVRHRAQAHRLVQTAAGVFVPTSAKTEDGGDYEAEGVGLGAPVAILAVADRPVLAGLVLRRHPPGTEVTAADGERRPFPGVRPLIDALVLLPAEGEEPGATLMTVVKCPHETDLIDQARREGKADTVVLQAPRYLIVVGQSLR